MLNGSVCAGSPRDDLPVTVLPDRQDLAGAPVAQPHPTIPPPGRLGKAELLDHHIHRHRSHPSIGLPSK